MRFTLGMSGEDQISRTLLRVSDRASDCRPVFEAIADRLADTATRNFDAQGAAEGQRWAPLSTPYARWKARKYPGRKILVLTGALRQDLTRRPFGVEHITATSMTIGTNKPYAQYHQKGTPTMPRRRPFELSGRSRTDITKMLQKWLMRGEL